MGVAFAPLALRLAAPLWDQAPNCQPNSQDALRNPHQATKLYVYVGVAQPQNEKGNFVEQGWRDGAPELQPGVPSRPLSLLRGLPHPMAGHPAPVSAACGLGVVLV